MTLFSQDERVIETGIVYLRTVGFSYIFVGFSMMYSGAFRAMGDAKTPMYTTVFSLFLNAVLNALLIFGLGPFPRLGVFGGALATVISRLTEALLLIIISIRRNAPFVTRRREDFKWDKSFIKAMGSTGLPAFLHETLWSIGSILYKISYSSLGTAAFAAFNIDMTIQDLFFVAGLGLANGSGVIIGTEMEYEDYLIYSFYRPVYGHYGAYHITNDDKSIQYFTRGRKYCRQSSFLFFFFTSFGNDRGRNNGRNTS